jgi:hypothetical protein
MVIQYYKINYCIFQRTPNNGGEKTPPIDHIKDQDAASDSLEPRKSASNDVEYKNISTIEHDSAIINLVSKLQIYCDKVHFLKLIYFIRDYNTGTKKE